MTWKLRPNWVMNSWQATEPEPPQKSPAASTSRTMDWCSASKEAAWLRIIAPWRSTSANWELIERTVLLNGFGRRLAGQDLLGGLLLGLVVVGIPDQPVAHPVQHVDDVAKRLIHLAHGVVGRHLGRAAPAGAGDVLTRCPHLAGLILHRLRVHIETARHRPHLVRVSHKTRRHNSVSLTRGRFPVDWLLATRRPVSEAPPWRSPESPGCSHRVRPTRPSTPG